MSDIRRIEPVSTYKLKAGEVLTARPRFLEVDPADLYVDEVYQRDIAERGARLIRDIVENWNWANFKPPVVVPVYEPLRLTGVQDAHYHVIDGQHTAIAAATHNAMTMDAFAASYLAKNHADLRAKRIGPIPVMVVSADSIEARASAFIGQNTNRVAITKLQLFRSAVAAGDEDAMTAKQVCERARVKILHSAPGMGGFNERETMAVSAITALAKRQGAMVARQILEAIADARVAPVTNWQLRAAELLIRGDEYAQDRMTLPELTATIMKCRHDERYHANALAKALKVQLFKAMAMHWHRNRVRQKAMRASAA